MRFLKFLKPASFFYVLFVLMAPGANAAIATNEVHSFLKQFHTEQSSTSISLRFLDTDIRPRSAIMSEDIVDELLETQDYPKSISQIGSKSTSRAFLDSAPWSTSYWPTARGGIAARYADKGYPRSKDWRTNYSYINARPVGGVISSGNMNLLSPAEKYDLLVGDSNFTLTNTIWHDISGGGTRGAIASWAGICHGWAPASLKLAEPTRTVDVKTVNGQMIRFYPADIKALASMLWAKVSDVNFIGTKCVTSRPSRDEFGRVIDPKCHDTNPGTWHLAVLNMLGIRKAGFIMDVVFDYQIWNHPVYGYELTYFNPQTLEPTPFWRRATVEKNKFTIDKFAKHRTPGASHVIGVAMDVYYAIEVTPTHATRSQKSAKKIRYVYDLELNDKYEILGGEWYTAQHPDWMWAPKINRALTRAEKDSLPEDISTAGWDGNTSVPSDIAALAPRAARGMQPLATVVETLIELSKGE